MTATPYARPLIVPRGAGRRADPGSAILADAAATRGALGLVESRIPAAASPPRHIHRAEDEAFYTLDGVLDIVCGDERLRAEPGAFAYLPRGVVHTFRVVGDRPAHLLIMMVPAGFEEFFATHAGTDAEALAEIYRQHGVDIVGPPLGD
ncbi:MAG: cupin domain-containing protein [Streptosporangiaceae bacterium]